MVSHSTIDILRAIFHETNLMCTEWGPTASQSCWNGSIVASWNWVTPEANESQDECAISQSLSRIPDQDHAVWSYDLQSDLMFVIYASMNSIIISVDYSHSHSMTVRTIWHADCGAAKQNKTFIANQFHGMLLSLWNDLVEYGKKLLCSTYLAMFERIHLQKN